MVIISFTAVATNANGSSAASSASNSITPFVPAVVTGTFPCGQQLVKYGYKDKAECILCKKAHEENGGSWKGVLPKETIGHIQSAGCLGQKEVVTAAHNACIRELLQEIEVHGKASETADAGMRSEVS